MDYMESTGAHQLKKLEEMCAELRRELSADERFAMTEEFYARYPVDPARLVIDVRGTGLTGFEVSDRLAEQGVDVEMADFCRIVGIPSVRRRWRSPVGITAFVLHGPERRPLGRRRM